MCDFARTMAIAAAQEILIAAQGESATRARRADFKGRRDLVTDVDRRIEALLAEQIRARYPDDAILAEETMRISGRSGRVWILDPLDGTTNFVHEHPLVCVSIALADGYEGPPEPSAVRGDPLASGFLDPQRMPRMLAAAVCAPFLGEIYWAGRGTGAFLAKLPQWRATESRAARGDRITADAAPPRAARRLRVSSTSRLADSLVATGFAYRRNEVRNDNLGNFAKVALAARGIRRGGSAALDLCFVAAGRFDAFWELYLKPWDVAAGLLLVEEAGGRVSDLSGGPRAPEGVAVLASNGEVHEEVRGLLEGPDPDWVIAEQERLWRDS